MTNTTAGTLRLSNPNPRIGGFIQTFSGVNFYPLDPEPDDVLILDIAHALSMQCRFSGHSSSFYSVAQHAFLVSHMVPPEFALAGLLHDASEAYLVDLPTPIKHGPAGERYRRAEANVQAVINGVFCLPEGAHEALAVHEADRRMLATEVRDLMAGPLSVFELRCEPYPFTIVPLSPADAEAAFLTRFLELAPPDDHELSGAAFEP